MEKPILFLEQTAAEKLWSYTMLCSSEISGLGKVQIVDGQLLVTDIAIFEQEVSGTHSTITAKELAAFQAERVKKGESMKEWCLWWHSHADMNVFFSGTDTGTIDSSTEFPYLASLVVNHKRETKARLDLFTPIRAHFDMEVKELQAENKEIKELCQKEIDKKVKRYIPQTAPVNVPQRSGFRTEPDYRDNIRRNEEAYDYKDYDMPKKYNEMGDEEIRAEYLDQKEYLEKQINYLKKQRGLKYRTALVMRQRELKELLEWGQSVGIEKLTTKGK